MDKSDDIIRSNLCQLEESGRAFARAHVLFTLIQNCIERSETKQAVLLAQIGESIVSTAGEDIEHELEIAVEGARNA
jgi:hypothetical protein